jgi:lipopolysaccharide export system protein LptA
VVKSKIIQIILFGFGLLIFIFTYLSFFQKTNSNYLNETERLEKSLEQSLDMKKIVKKDKDNDSVIEEDKNASNIISDLSYKNIDHKGNIFNINSKITKIFEDKEDLNFMEVVVCRIFLLDGSVIEIFADKAIYNTINYNTEFVGNVLVVKDENKITSNNLDFIFDKNLITIYNDVKYKGYNKFLTADKVDINLLNHKVNVYMYNKMSKVKANLRN